MNLKLNIEPVSTDDFYYDLFEGYIKPDDILEDKDANKVLLAIDIINDFQLTLDENELLNID